MGRPSNNLNDVGRILDKMRAKTEYPNPSDPDTCWLWTGNLIGGGSNSPPYGGIRINYAMWRVHRLSYTIYKGPIPKGVLVLHSCDNPRCWNPDHLFLGSNQDNTDDMRRKDRHPHMSKLVDMSKLLEEGE